jgi:hypothetical protein
MLTARCTSNENATYLEVTVRPNPSGRRTVRNSDERGRIGLSRYQDGRGFKVFERSIENRKSFFGSPELAFWQPQAG